MMYVHAGNSRIIRTKSIIGIFDMDSATMAPATREFLKRAEKDGRLVNIREELPKSFIVTEDPGKKVYVSQLSVGALIGRSREGE